MKKRSLLLTVTFVLAATVVSLAPPASATDKPATTSPPTCKAMTNVYPAQHLNCPDDSVPTAPIAKPTTTDPVMKKKTNLQKRWAERLEQRASRLEGKRLEKCQAREDKINTLIDRSVTRSKTKLAVFVKIDTMVRDFYAKKQLAADDYADAVKAADDKKAVVQAAIDAIGSLTFDCDKADGAKPAGIIKSAVETRHQAFVGYRDAIVNLIHVVKAAGEEK